MTSSITLEKEHPSAQPDLLKLHTQLERIPLPPPQGDSLQPKRSGGLQWSARGPE
ncbi:hypothetical protein PR003_g34043 [Phytophthora rubi]|uniref:Uncharacterized protein n=1 Tax=Phytophthora rubi TaxID=129364 RepID=A0A6A4AQG2_9STRA|nr:hypothetical protein PR003_g34043 [Phytophthora rubi]